jgi:hypothetical protein
MALSEFLFSKFRGAVSMFCPRCSQPQSPEEVRFCSRCGFQLAAVSQLMRTDGMPFINAGYAKEKLPLVKREELRKGAKLIFLSFFSVIPSFILAAIIDSPLPLIIPVITFLVGLAQVLYYFLFGESIMPVKKQEFVFNENERQMNFQPAQEAPFGGFGSRSFTTAEFIQPPSVTESTSNFMRNR